MKSTIIVVDTIANAIFIYKKITVTYSKNK